MNDKQARQIVQDALGGHFDKANFVRLVKNILNHVQDAPFTYAGNLIFDDFEDSIQRVERVGKYQSPDDKKVDILIVHLKKETSLERARTKQRNFVAKYLKGSRGGQLKDAALVAFVAPNGDWRFSFVKVEYTLTDGHKVTEEFTPARRYSFLVGPNENSHTAQSRLMPILLKEEDPTLEDLGGIFSVEPVTEGFFEQYRDLFLHLKELLDDIITKTPGASEEFKTRDINTADFAKKLLGQIVFLYFLQKKGWFGVPRDEEWGGGSKNFLRELFEKKHGDYQNFFNDILEPLFYNTLAIKRHQDWEDRFQCRIPFLNGGLFDPLNDYDWINVDILLLDNIFSNTNKTKGGDIGNGILDVFDRYNFTVNENEPLEKEVAVDPEMLGKVFENLLEVKDRKSKGTYYTPREIVQYMCQESLANYLATQLEDKVAKTDIAKLIKYGEDVADNEIRVIREGRQTDAYKHQLSETIRENAELIDAKLASIRVCDPAVGSGAFLVGMMNEIVRARNALSPYINDGAERPPYHFKREAIEHCLYGVDVDLSATEIAKLRLWLSLIVDEEDRSQIKPLPNLDYKMVQGNSLLSMETDIFNSESLVQLKELKLSYFNETDTDEKQKYRRRIAELFNRIADIDYEMEQGYSPFNVKEGVLSTEQFEQLEEAKQSYLNETDYDRKQEYRRRIYRIAGRDIKDKFDFKVHFSEVFHEKQGFDVVIANPPYGAEMTSDELKKVKENLKLTKNTNSAAAFIDYSINRIVNDKGILTFIVPKSLLFVESWFDLVKAMLKHSPLIVDVEKAFKKVLLEQVVFMFGKSIQTNSYTASKFLNNQFVRTIQIPNDLVLKYSAWVCDISEEDIRIAEKVTSKPIVYMRDISQTKRGAPLQKYLKKRGDIPVIRGKSIFKYGLNDVYEFLNSDDINSNSQKLSFLRQPKIISQRIITHVQAPTPYLAIKATLDIQGNILSVDTVENTVLNHKDYDLRYIVAILNSRFVGWFAYKFIFCGAIMTMDLDKYYMGKIPIAKISGDEQKPVIEIVDKILAITGTDDYLQNPTKQAQVREYEKQIDQLVYDLYDLTPGEIKIIEEGNNPK